MDFLPPIESGLTTQNVPITKRFVKVIWESHIATKLICALLFSVYIICAIIGDYAYQQTCLIPAATLFSLRVWNLFTYVFVEQHILTCIMNVMFLLLTSRLIFSFTTLSRVFFLSMFATLSTSISVIAFTYFIRFLFWDIAHYEYSHQMFYDVPYSGFVVVCSALVVLLKQHVPDLKLFWKIRGKYLFFVYVGLLISANIWYSHPEQIFLSVISGFFSWFYLRFHERHDGVRGDHSDHFSFGSFFPDPLKTFVDILGEKLLPLGVLIRIIPKVDPLEKNLLKKNSESMNLNEMMIDVDVVKMTIAEEEIEKRLEEKRKKTTKQVPESPVSPTE